MLDGLGGDHELLALATAAAAALWLLAAAVLYLARQPDAPPVGEHTLELGPEPPAVANFLVHRFRLTEEAVPATLLDLAARRVLEIEQRGPGNYYVRLRGAADNTLAGYELRVLRHLEGLARDGVVPAQALTTGRPEQSKRWRRAFANAVIADAQRRGLARDRLDHRLFTAFGVAAVVPAGLVWALFGQLGAGIAAFVGALAVLGWIRARHPKQPTPAGLAAASRWLGVRAALAENEVFETRSPLEVVLWDRLLAYGAALGAAAGASCPLPMGAESDDHAWSAYGGRWREVRIRYPYLLPLGWGLTPINAALRGIAMAGIAGAALVLFAPIIGVPSGWALAIVGVLAALLCAALGIGVTLIAMAVADLGAAASVTGPILRLRTFGTDKRPRHYVAVDDGTSSTVRAWIVDPFRVGGLEQGDVVTVEVTRALRSVRSIHAEPVLVPDRVTTSRSA